MELLPTAPVCQAKTKNGEPCRGRVGPNGRYCRNHDPETRELAIADAKRGAENRRKKSTDELRERDAEDPAKVIDPMFRALEATRTYQQNGETITVPDYATQLKASEMIMDRLEGKPTQSTEIAVDAESFLRVLMGSSPAHSIEASAYCDLAARQPDADRTIDIDAEDDAA